MKNPSKLKKITKGIEESLCNKLSEDEIRIRDSINNTKIDTANHILEAFGDDENIKYEIDVRGKETKVSLVDIKPKNLYTACMFLGFEIGEECPEEGQVEFTRVIIMYDHKDGMSIVPKDPLDDLDDIIPVF